MPSASIQRTSRSASQRPLPGSDCGSGAHPECDGDREIRADAGERDPARPGVAPAIRDPRQHAGDERHEDEPGQDHKKMTIVDDDQRADRETSGVPADASGFRVAQRAPRGPAAPGQPVVNAIDAVSFVGTREPDERPDEYVVVQPVEAPSAPPEPVHGLERRLLRHRGHRRPTSQEQRPRDVDAA